ncbi:MAG: cyclic nucleotide-binding domain-containing protein [Pseudomonadota bacterium]
MAAFDMEPLLLKLLSSIILFRGLETDDLAELLRGATKAPFPAGSLVFGEGQAGHALYVVVTGRFEVFKTVAPGSTAHIAFVDPGEHFGEMALVTERPRTASVRAVADSVALRLTKGALFDQPRLAAPLLKNIAALMSDHLREMNQEVLLLDVTRVEKKRLTDSQVTG